MRRQRAPRPKYLAFVPRYGSASTDLWLLPQDLILSETVVGHQLANWISILNRLPSTAALVAVVGSICILAGCAPLRGSPNDPEDSATVSDTLQPWFSAKTDQDYAALPAEQRQAQRNLIVMNRLRALNISFADFER